MKPRPSSASAFTLLEVIIVLAIMMMLAGLGMGLAFNFDDRADSPKDHLIRMAKQASRASIVEGHPVSIAFSKSSFVLNGGGSGGESSCSIPKDTKIEFQRWNGGVRWQPIEGLVWTFYPTGISDALHFRFDDQDGRTELKFNPLTGTPANQ